MCIIHLFIGFRGRISRLAFLLALLLISILHVSVWKIVSVNPDLELQSAVALLILLMWPPLVISVKRYHDLNSRGLFALIPALGVTIAGACVGVFLAGDQGPYRALAPLFEAALGGRARSWGSLGAGSFEYASALISIMTATTLPVYHIARIFFVLLLVNLAKLLCFAGTSGPNRFGDEPSLAEVLLGRQDEGGLETSVKDEVIDEAVMQHAKRLASQQAAAEAEHNARYDRPVVASVAPPRLQRLTPPREPSLARAGGARAGGSRTAAFGRRR